MKRVIAVILVLCMALSLCACSSSGSGSASGEKVIKIGVFEPSSGDSASGGKKEILGMQYANKETPTVDIGGTTYNVELVYADNGSDPAKAPTAAAELVSKDVSLVLGTYGSSCAMAGGPVFDEAGLAAIGVTCTNPNITAGNDYYFRICFLDNFQAQVLVNFAKEKFSAQKAYCLGELGNEYDQGLISFFEQNFDGEVIKDSFPTNNSDFNTYLNKAKSEGADVIFTPVSIAYATQILSQAASLGIEAPFLGSDTLDDNMVLEAISGTDIQLYVSTFYQEGGNADFDAGIKEWINANDGDRSIFSFVRKSPTRRNNILIVCNFTPVARPDYRVGVPKKKQYKLIMDEQGLLPKGKVFKAEKKNCDNREFSFAYPLEAYGVGIFTY